MDFYEDLYNCFVVDIDYTLCCIAYYVHYMFDQSSCDCVGQMGQLGQLM